MVMAEDRRRSPVKWLVFIGVVAVLLFAATSVNTIPTLDEKADSAWSQVLNQYQRRADLIPNLVATVRGYADFEQETLTAVVEARAKVGQMTISPEIFSDPAAFQQFEQNQAALSSALSRLLVVVERYPDLKANQNFLTLQSQLEGAENRIAVARRDYIGAVQDYNIELRTIPGRWFAAWLYSELGPRQNFSAPESVQEVPEVAF
jgi:LemA protein